MSPGAPEGGTWILSSAHSIPPPALADRRRYDKEEPVQRPCNITGRERAMLTSSRREFLTRSSSLLALTTSSLKAGVATAAMGPNDKFDLVVKGGDVLDPSQNLRARRDIGI